MRRFKGRQPLNLEISQKGAGRRPHALVDRGYDGGQSARCTFHQAGQAVGHLVASRNSAYWHRLGECAVAETMIWSPFELLVYVLTETSGEVTQFA
jgi:hypothetical protein